jgi:hypothetical protein
MATEFWCNINVYQGFHPVTQYPLGGVKAIYDIDICLITDLHYKSIVKVNQEEQIGVASEAAVHNQAAVSDAGQDTPYDDQENEVPAVADILGDGMARPDAARGEIADMAQGAQGAAAQESGESDELSGIAQVNALEYDIRSKSNQTICSKLHPSCDENTLPQLQALHPPGDLNFNRQF